MSANGLHNVTLIVDGVQYPVRHFERVSDHDGFLYTAKGGCHRLDLIDVAKTGAPSALLAEGNISDVHVPADAIPVDIEVALREREAAFSDDVIPSQRDAPREFYADAMLGKPYSAVAAAREEKHPTRSNVADATCSDECRMVPRRFEQGPWRSRARRPKSMTAFSRDFHASNQRWWHDLVTGEKLDRDMGEMLMLVISEIAECLEGERKNMMDDHLPHRKMAEVELADAVIRLADIIGAQEINIDIHISDVERGLKSMPDNKGAALLLVIRPLQSITYYKGWVFGQKLARCLCRIMQYAEKHDYDLWGAVAEKMEYNKHRADHKPEARLAANGKKF